jgi:hypothetical protein
MRIGAEGFPATAPSRPGGSLSVPAEAPARAKADSLDSLDLSPEARTQLTKLKARDQEVRSHEAAHMAAGGSLVRGAATYSYQQGPDGNRYAIGGEVQLDASAVPGNPRATLAKAEQLRAAALAPADPSGQDHAVAAEASAMAAQATLELARLQSAQAKSSPLGAKLDMIG